jgi:predicted MFS family arabinose efflux permease
VVETVKKTHYPYDLYVLIFSSLFVFLAVETTRPIIPLYIVDIGANPLELGLIVGILSFSLMILKIPLGVLAERFSRVYVILLAVIGQSLTQFFYSIANLALFYPIQILHAFSVAALVPMAISVSQNLAPSGKTGEVMGLFLTSYGLANSFGPYLCSYLLTFFSYKGVFQVASIIPLFGLLPLLALRKTNALKSSSREHRSNPFSSLTNIIHSRDLLILTFSRFSYAITYSFYITFFVVYAANTLLLAPTLIAFLLGTRGMADVILRIPAGRVVDKVDYKWGILSASGILAFVYLILIEASDFFLLTLLMVIFGFGVGLRVVSEWTMLGDRCEAAARNVAAAYLSTMFDIGSTIGAVLAGILVTIWSISLIFKLASLLMIISFTTALFIHRRLPSKIVIVQ